MNKVIYSLIAFTLSGLLVSCATGKTNAAPSAAGVSALVKTVPLTQEEAVTRFRQVARPHYLLWFGLDADSKDFDGRAVIQFELRPKAKEAGKSLFVDLKDARIKSVVLNGVAISEPNYDGNRITFPINQFTSGSNRLEIAYTRTFAEDGLGFHRFVDTEDQQTYVYTHFEPYYANRAFPCFDQPDLKGTFETTITAPDNWTVISNSTEQDVSTVDGRKAWHFAKTPTISTYLFAIAAGPFKVFKHKARSSESIPMRVFARASVAKNVDAPNWFSITEAGLDYYGTLFGYPYPFTKYDQIIVPEFRAGAMENPGAVMFSERFIFRSEPSVADKRDRADTILHEMAHMWFGDLVTMKWWNGLWLNESFATYMAAEATAQISGFPGSWLDFFAGTKQWAYWEDSLPTTHPIDQPVADTAVSNARFDGITYGKGAAVLKQLAYFLGKEDFQEGLQRYFQKHAFKNTNLKDFIAALSEASGKNLSAWQRSWLLNAGTDSVAAQFVCSEGKITNFSIRATAPVGLSKENVQTPDARPHKTEIALWTAPRAGAFTPSKTMSVAYTIGETQIGDLAGTPCPSLVHPNYNDHDFIKVELDPVTLATLREGKLGLVTDPLMRGQLVADLWRMVLDAKLSAGEYANLALAHASREKDPILLERLLETLAHRDPRRSSVARFLDGQERIDFRTRAETAGRSGLKHAPGGSDAQRYWLEFFLATAGSEDSLKYLQRLLAGKNSLPGLDLIKDLDRRWEIVKAVAREAGKPGAPTITEAESLIETELKKDPSDHGQDSALQARALLPDSERKNKWREEFKATIAGTNPTGLQPSKLRAALSGYAGLWQEALVSQGDEAYFQSIPELLSKARAEKLVPYVRGLLPAGCDSANVTRMTTLLGTELDPMLKKTLEVGRYEIERCLKVRAVMANRPQTESPSSSVKVP